MTESLTDQPSPAYFDLFLPWACLQFALEQSIFIFRSSEGALQGKIGRKEVESNVDQGRIESDTYSLIDDDSVVKVETLYDNADDLVEINFLRNKYIPPKLIKIISLFVKFHPRLRRITINSGLDQHALSELKNLLNASKISEIILDNTVIPQANYYILLDGPSSLKYLSLARCCLNDEFLNKLAPNLLTSNLIILNLSSNKITDTGAVILGNILRSNRKLSYLNLAGNKITDKGADSILSSLVQFRLTGDEVCQKRLRYFTYLKNNEKIKNSEIPEVLTEKSISIKKLKAGEPINQVENSEIGFIDPFQPENVYVIRGEMFCFGNNALSYLNLAYNNISYLTVKKLHRVFKTQEELRRKPRGLMDVRIDGNNIPKNCMELTDIGNIINGCGNVDGQTSAKKSKFQR